MLKMKKSCESCQSSTPESAIAFICSYECTFCTDCAANMSYVCPNCGGELVQRPIRLKKPMTLAVEKLSSKVFPNKADKT